MTDSADTTSRASSRAAKTAKQLTAAHRCSWCRATRGRRGLDPDNYEPR